MLKANIMFCLEMLAFGLFCMAMMFGATVLQIG